MASLRKRIKHQRRTVGFVPSKPWTPKPTFAELMQRMRENMRGDIKTLLPVHQALAHMREGFSNISPLPMFAPHTQSWAKDLWGYLEQQSKLPATKSRTIAISTPVAADDAFDRLFVGSNPTSWKTEEQTSPFMEKLAETLKAYKAQPVDKLILPPVMYDALGKSTSQPMMSFADGQVITLGIDVGCGYDETAGMLVRRHPDGSMEILKRFTVGRDDS